MKKFTAIIMIVLISLTASNAVYAGNVYLYGLSVGLKISEKKIDGVIYVPLRTSCDFIGAKLEWNSKAKTVTVYNPNLKNEKALARLTIGKTSYTIYDEKGAASDIESENAPKIVDSYTYIPLEFFEAAFGLKAVYEEKTGNIFLE